jgi:DNA-binding response OmpR family regulator
MSAIVSSKKEKILIVAGDGAFGEQVMAALKRDGYENVFLVKNGTEGLKNIYDLLPHLILLDITLPGIDGYEILAKKQAENLLAKIPVFLLSTQGVPINMRNIPPGSVTEYIMAFHVDPETLVEKVDRQFDHKKGIGSSGADGSGGSLKNKVLWVEDDKLIGSILSKKLIAAGFDLLHAKNGEEALGMLKETIPNVIIVDLILPGMSGFDILQAVNADDRLKRVPKMVLSNLSKPSDIEKARVLGAQRFLVKAATSLDQIVAELKAMSK